MEDLVGRVMNTDDPADQIRNHGLRLGASEVLGREPLLIPTLHAGFDLSEDEGEPRFHIR